MVAGGGAGGRRRWFRVAGNMIQPWKRKETSKLERWSPYSYPIAVHRSSVAIVVFPGDLRFIPAKFANPANLLRRLLFFSASLSLSRHSLYLLLFTIDRSKKGRAALVGLFLVSSASWRRTLVVSSPSADCHRCMVEWRWSRRLYMAGRWRRPCC